MKKIRRRLVSLVTRRYPFLSGCGSFANSRFVQTAAGGGQGHVWARLDSGLEALVPIGDYVGRAAFFVGDLDRKISEVAKRIVRPGDTVIDIGANLGLVTLPLSSRVTERGTVHAFEPNAEVRALLDQSLRRNGLRNVRLHSCALGTDECERTLSYPISNAGRGTLCPTANKDGWTSASVAVRPLSVLADEIDLSAVRFVKIDVEGHELDVLRGAARWLATRPPAAIVFESNGSADESADVLSLLTECGYSLYSIPKRLLALRLTPFKLGQTREVVCHDMLAVFRDCGPEVMARFAT